jgi:hypothetical protein
MPGVIGQASIPRMLSWMIQPFWHLPFASNPPANPVVLTTFGWFFIAQYLGK